MNRKTVMLTEIIAPYRIPVFNALATHQGIDLKVIFLSETHPTLRQWRVYKMKFASHMKCCPLGGFASAIRTFC